MSFRLPIGCTGADKQNMIRQYDSKWNKRLLHVTILLAIAFLYVSLLGVSTVSANGPAQDSETAKFETDFMQMMIDHHHMATEMATICLQKAAHDELRTMCQNIIDAQTKEIQEMQSWLSSWYQIDKQPMMMQDGEQMMSQLNAASGADFEMMFMQMMIEHHTTAIQEATPCVQRAEHQELKTLCQNIISSQQQEIAEMETWLAQWYNVSADAAQATPEASATATPSATSPSTLPQTGGTFEMNVLPIVIGLLLLGAGVVLVQLRRKIG
jgi:LPXTG-motif cell wall-anchored protein